MQQLFLNFISLKGFPCPIKCNTSWWKRTNAVQCR